MVLRERLLEEAFIRSREVIWHSVFLGLFIQRVVKRNGCSQLNPASFLVPAKYLLPDELVNCKCASLTLVRRLLKPN